MLRITAAVIVSLALVSGCDEVISAPGVLGGSSVEITLDVDTPDDVQRIDVELERESCSGETFQPIYRVIVSTAVQQTGATSWRYRGVVDRLPAGCYRTFAGPIDRTSLKSFRCFEPNVRHVRVPENAMERVFMTAACESPVVDVAAP